MSLTERRAKEKLDCYTIDEIYDFFNQFYNVDRRWSKDIIIKEEFTLDKSDVSIEIKSYGDRNIANDIFIKTWAGGWSSKQKGLHLEYTSTYNEDHIYDWYIRDLQIGSYFKISKSDILPMLVEFIMVNEDERYELPIALKRNLLLYQLKIE